jgi:iron transport multicopper oxidase
MTVSHQPLERHPITMKLTALLVSFALLLPAYASIGPEANLYIVNKVIAPDGFNRS